MSEKRAKKIITQVSNLLHVRAFLSEKIRKISPFLLFVFLSFFFFNIQISLIRKINEILSYPVAKNI